MSEDDGEGDVYDPATRATAKKRRATDLAMQLLGVGVPSTLLPMALWLPVLRLLLPVLSTAEDDGVSTFVDTAQAVVLLGRLQQVRSSSPHLLLCHLSAPLGDAGSLICPHCSCWGCHLSPAGPVGTERFRSGADSRRGRERTAQRLRVRVRQLCVCRRILTAPRIPGCNRAEMARILNGS